MLFLLFVSILLFSLSSQATADNYYVSFTGDNESAQDAVFVMEIDQFGNVVKGPVVSKPAAKVNAAPGVSGATALSYSETGRLLIWVATADGKILRGIVNPATLISSTVRGFGVTVGYEDSEDVFLQATQQGRRFLAAEVSKSKLKAFNVTGKGAFGGSSWRLSPRTDGGNSQGTVSPDGHFAVSSIFNAPYAIYVQMLNSKGLPSGDPFVIAPVNEVRSVDVTNDLGGKRFVVYGEDDADGPLDDLMYLQAIDNSTGKKVGSRILVAEPDNRGDDPQGIAVDPLGRFFVYAAEFDSQSCGGEDLIYYQALSSLGQPVGNPIPLVPCDLVGDDIIGVDILKK